MVHTDPEGEDLRATAFVFGDEIGQSIASVKTSWRSACERAGVPTFVFRWWSSLRMQDPGFDLPQWTPKTGN